MLGWIIELLIVRKESRMSRRRHGGFSPTRKEIHEKHKILCAQEKHSWGPLEIKRNFQAICFYCHAVCLTRSLSKEMAGMVRTSAKIRREISKKVQALHGSRENFCNAGY